MTDERNLTNYIYPITLGGWAPVILEEDLQIAAEKGKIILSRRAKQKLTQEIKFFVASSNLLENGPSNTEIKDRLNRIIKYISALEVEICALTRGSRTGKKTDKNDLAISHFLTLDNRVDISAICTELELFKTGLLENIASFEKPKGNVPNFPLINFIQKAHAIFIESGGKGKVSYKDPGKKGGAFEKPGYESQFYDFVDFILSNIIKKPPKNEGQGLGKSIQRALKGQPKPKDA